MTVLYVAYNFDAENYAQALKPIIQSLLSDDYSVLRALAAATAQNNPQLWEELQYWRYFPDELEKEGEVYDNPFNRIDFWLTIIKLSYCERIPLPKDYVLQMRDAQKICEASSYIDTILWGTNLQTFYEQILSNVSREKNFHVNETPLWCKPGMVYWLDRTEIEPLLAWLKDHKTCFNETPAFTAFKAAENLFIRALQEQKALLMATLD